MPTTVAAIESFGQGRHARRIVLSDTSVRVTADAVVRAAAIDVGDAYDADTLDRTCSALEPEQAREVALRLLGHRERSHAELARRLVERGFPAATAHEVVERLASVGLVDDERFAELWIRSRLASGHGARGIRQELAERGIDPEVAEAALREQGHGDSELDRARAVIGSRPVRDRRDRDRQVRRLISRGFSFDIALRAVDATACLTCDDEPQSGFPDPTGHLD